MSFAHPAMLTGLLALGLPLAAHLFGHGPEVRRGFSATRFLVPQAAPGRGRRRLRDVPLLAARLALLAAAVLAAAAPMGLGAPVAEGAQRLALLVDVGPSSAWTGADDVPLWRRARDDAAAALAEARPGTVASLHVVGAAGGDVDEPATADVARLQATLAQLAGPGAAWRPGAAGEGLARARAALAEAPGGGELRAFGPFVAHDWPAPGTAGGAAAAGGQPVRVVLVDAARRLSADGATGPAALPPLDNLAVEDVRLADDSQPTAPDVGAAEGPAGMAEPSAAAGPGAPEQGPRVQVRLHNYGAAASGPRALTLTLAGRVVQRTVVQVPAGAAHEVALTLPPLPGGRVALRAALAPDAADGLAADDAFVRYVRAQAPLRVLGVAGGGSADADTDTDDLGPTGRRAGAADDPSADGGPYAAPLHFVERALRHPVEAAAAVAWRACVPGALAEELQAARDAGAPIDVVLLADVPALDDAATAALQAHLGRGGGAFAGLGEAVAAAAEAHPAAPWLPCTLRELADAQQAQGRPAQLAPIDFAHPLLRGLDAGLSPSLAAAQVRRFVHVEGRAQRPEDAVLRLEGGAPLVVARDGDGEGQAGRGRRLVWTSSLDLRWTDLPLRTAFVPLLQQLVRWCGHAAASALPTALRAGEGFWAYLPPGADRVRLRPTAGAAVTADAQGAASAAEGGVARLVAPAVPGSYVVEARTQGSWRPLGEGRDPNDAEVHVHPALRAADLRPASPATLQAYAGLRGAEVADSRAARRTPRAASVARPYAPWLLAAALALGLLEAALAWPASPKKTSQLGVVPRLLSWFLRLRPALRFLRRTRVM